MKKNSCTPINPKKYSCYGLKKIHTRTLITKKNSCGSEIPLPLPPHNFSNGPSLILIHSIDIFSKTEECDLTTFFHLYFNRIHQPSSGWMAWKRVTPHYKHITNNWPAENFKTHVTSCAVHFSSRYSPVTLLSKYPF